MPFFFSHLEHARSFLQVQLHICGVLQCVQAEHGVKGATGKRKHPDAVTHDHSGRGRRGRRQGPSGCLLRHVRNDAPIHNVPRQQLGLGWSVRKVQGMARKRKTIPVLNQRRRRAVRPPSGAGQRAVLLGLGGPQQGGSSPATPRRPAAGPRGSAAHCAGCGALGGWRMARAGEGHSCGSM